MITLDELEKLLAAATPRPWTRVSDKLAAGNIKAPDNAALIVAAVNALPGLLAEVEVLRRLAPEYFQWPGKSGADTAPEWLQDRLKYGGASVDGDMLAVYYWHNRRALAAPGDYVVHGEEWLWVLPARAALKETGQ